MKTLGYEGRSQPSETWSILDGDFKPTVDFGIDQEANEIGASKGSYSKQDEELGNAIYYTQWLLYALNACNYNIRYDQSVRKKAIEDIRDAALACLRIDEVYRREDLRKLTAESIHPSEVPVMLALKKMQEREAIDYDERTTLDAIVRTLYLKQTKAPTT